MTNELKLKLYPAVIVVLGLGLSILLLSRVEIQISQDLAVEDSPSGRSASIPDSMGRRSQPIPPGNIAEETRPAPLTIPSPTELPPLDAAGSLRISNQTRYPIRVALLPQQSDLSPKSQPELQQSELAYLDSSSLYSQPVHWDFSPEEGRTKGLIMSLPNQNLRLQSGDVLVAFAQDGSRRYWGPYVVGKTPLPIWSNEQKEWSLLLQP